MAIKVNGKSIQTDDEGYLIDPIDWNEEVAKQLAAKEDLELNDEYWQILRFMRSYYDDHKIAADARFVIKFLTNKLGYEKKEARKALFKLFPYGYVKQACKIAGMKRPRAWSTG